MNAADVRLKVAQQFGSDCAVTKFTCDQTGIRRTVLSCARLYEAIFSPVIPDPPPARFAGPSETRLDENSCFFGGLPVGHIHLASVREPRFEVGREYYVVIIPSDQVPS